MATATTAQAPVRWAREYETIYILRPDVDPDEADKVAKRVSEVVERFEGKLTRVDTWGKRRLAYIIQKQTRGIFVYVRYFAFGDIVHEIERNLRMLDAVIRYQTVRIRDRVDPSAIEIDPEEVKFLRIEPTVDEEEEPALEQRLGMVPERSRRDDDDEESGDDSSLSSDEDEEE